jgi:hypothetical protein
MVGFLFGPFNSRIRSVRWVIARIFLGKPLHGTYLLKVKSVHARFCRWNYRMVPCEYVLKPFGRLNPSVSVLVHMSYQMFEHFLRYGNLVETNPSTWMCFCSYSKGDHCRRKSSESIFNTLQNLRKTWSLSWKVGKIEEKWSSNPPLIIKLSFINVYAVSAIFHDTINPPLHQIFRHMGVSWNRGTQNGWFLSWKIRWKWLKMDDLGGALMLGNLQIWLKNMVKLCWAVSFQWWWW